MKTFVIGDIHGAHKALEQVLEKSKFNKKKDLLITLGDICDGWPFVRECVDILLTIPYRIDIRGNHDDTFVDWLNKGIHPFQWSQGALATAKSYARNSNRDISIMGDINSGGTTNLSRVEIPDDHIKFFEKQHYYYHDKDRNYCFVHGGFNRHELISEQDKSILLWDRDLFMSAMSDNSRNDENRKKYPFRIKDGFEKIFIGHTSVTNWDINRPVFTDKVINLDTGAGFNGKLTIMNVDTLEYFQSDLVKTFYKNIKGR